MCVHIVHMVFPSPPHHICDMSGSPDVSYFLHYFLCANHHETPPVNVRHGSPFPCSAVFLCMKVLIVTLLSLLFRQAEILSEQHPSVKVILNATFSLNTSGENSVFDFFFPRVIILAGFLDNFSLILLAFLLWIKTFFERVKHSHVQNGKGMGK